MYGTGRELVGGDRGFRGDMGAMALHTVGRNGGRVPPSTGGAGTDETRRVREHESY